VAILCTAISENVRIAIFTVWMMYFGQVPLSRLIRVGGLDIPFLSLDDAGCGIQRISAISTEASA
jgi:hypothetical protein